MSLWTVLGFSGNPYDSRSLLANAEGAELLVGRDLELRTLLSQLANSSLHPTLEGDNGVGKTSLVLVAAYNAMQARMEKKTYQAFAPVPTLLQIGTDSLQFERQALMAIAQALIEHESYLRNCGHDVSSLSELKRWLNEPIISGGGGGIQILGVGANAEISNEANTSVGFSDSGFERVVIDALRTAFPTAESGALIAVIDNMELLGRSNEARRVLERIRDTSLSLPGVRWVLCGAKGIVRASVSSPRLTGRIGRPLEIAPLKDDVIEPLIEARLAYFAVREDARAPVGPVEFRHLYDICNANLRDALKYAQEFCMWLDVQEELERPQSEFLGLLEIWLAEEASQITSSIKLQPRMWKLFDDLAAAGGTCAPGDFEAFGFSSPQRMRTNFAELERADLISAEIDEDDLRRRTVSITSKGWLVNYSRSDFATAPTTP